MCSNRLKEGDSWKDITFKGEVKMWIGHWGPRTDEKWRIKGTRSSRSRVSRITATLFVVGAGASSGSAPCDMWMNGTSL